MAKAKKAEGNQPDAVEPPTGVSIEDFIRTRDSVVTGLATLQSAVQDLSRAYIAHTNNVISKSNPGSELISIANPLDSSSALFGNATAPATVAPAAKVEEDAKPAKKKRKPIDPNAPKRALTPFFLYMQHARPILAKELSNAAAKEIADEGTKRWQQMESGEKDQWHYKYAVNLCRYNAKVKAYKAGEPVPEISDAEAKRMYDEQSKNGVITEEAPVPAPVVFEHTEDPAEEDDEEEEAEAPPPPPKSPAAKKRKTGKESATKVAESPVEPKPEVKTPAKEKKKTKKAADSVQDSATAPASSPAKGSSQATIKKDKKSKKRKSEAGAGDDA